MKSVLVFLTLALLASCASNDNPPCRRVTAEQFMRPHLFKGVVTDQFIGTTGAGPTEADTTGMRRAFKQVWEMGLNHGWAVLWVPVAELPPDYVREANRKPNR